jgi:precorrin-4 methylase
VIGDLDIISPIAERANGLAKIVDEYVRAPGVSAAVGTAAASSAARWITSEHADAVVSIALAGERGRWYRSVR